MRQRIYARYGVAVVSTAIALGISKLTDLEQSYQERAKNQNSNEILRKREILR